MAKAQKAAQMKTIDKIMRIGPVVPVLVIDDARQARPLAEALVAGGLTVVEVTLRALSEQMHRLERS